MVLDHLFGPEPPAHLDRLVDSASAGREVETDRLPFGAEPARADTHDGPAAAHDVEGGDGARRDERVAQPEEVHVRRELRALGAPREERQVGEHVEHRRARRDGRVFLTGEG